MVTKEKRKVIFLLSLITTITAGVISLIGILRTEIYLPFTPDELLPGALSQDTVSFIASLGLIMTMISIRKGSNRAWVVWIGLTGYLFYAYAIYSFDRVYNVFFLFYISIVGLTVYSIIVFFRYADLSIFQSLAKRRIPRKSIAVFFLFLVGMFLIVWMGLIIPGIQSKLPPHGNSIFVLDLSFFLPLFVIGAIQLFQKRPFGDFLSAVILIKMGTLGISVFFGELLRPLFNQDLNPPMIGLFAVLGLGSLLFALIVFLHFGYLESPSRDN